MENINKHIIIVEDDFATQELYKLILKKNFSNITYEIYSDGESTLKRIIKNHFDLLITDVLLIDENIDGLKLARCAYNLGKPIFIITGTDYWNKLKFYINNIDMLNRIQYMQKPIKIDIFKNKLNKLLGFNDIPLNVMFQKIIL